MTTGKNDVATRAVMDRKMMNVNPRPHLHLDLAPEFQVERAKRVEHFFCLRTHVDFQRYKTNTNVYVKFRINNTRALIRT